MNRDWSFFSPETGEIHPGTYSGSSPDAMTPAGFEKIAGIHDCLNKRVDLATGEVVDWQPPKPQGDEFTDHEWIEQIQHWVPYPTLAGHKRDAWERVKRIRDEQFAARRVAGGIAYRIAADRANLESVIAGRNAAAVPPEYAASWRDADNVTHALNAAGLASLAGAMLMAGQAIYDRSWALQAQIDACSSAEEIAAVDLDAGWP